MSEDVMKISEKFLLSDMMKVALDEIRAMPFAWGVLPEKDQQKVIDKLEKKFTEAVRQIVNIIASDERPHVMANVEYVTFKDGIKVQLVVNKSENDRHVLADSTGSNVIVVIADAERYLKGEMPKAEPDQRTLDDVK